MSNRTSGRHRAPSRLSAASLTFARSAKAGVVLAASGGLAATVAIPANASPEGVGEVVPQSAIIPAADVLNIDLPAVPVPADQDNAVAVTEFGQVGFTGVAPPPPPPEPEPAPEPVYEEPVYEEPVAEEPVYEEVDRSESEAASRSYEREPAPEPEPVYEPEPEPAYEPEPAPAPSSGVLGIAASYVGTPYVMGGSSPSGFDCSGFTQYVFAQAGISLPRTVSGQMAATTPVSSPQPGDLVFWGTGHVGIYAGNGMVYDAGNPRVDTAYRAVFSGVTGYGRVG